MRYSGLVLFFMAIGCKNDQEIVTQEVVYSPSLSVTAPVDGAWMDAGATTLTADLNDVAAITVNGSAQASTASLSTPLTLTRGINHIVTEATGLDGSTMVDRRAVLAGAFAEAEGAIEQAAVVRLNQGGLDTVAGVAEGMIVVTDINDGLDAMNPVVDLEYSLGTGASVDLRSLYFSDPVLDLSPTSGALSLTVMLPDLFVDTDVTTSLLWIETDHDLELVADWAVVEADVALSLEDGAVIADLSDTTVSLEGFSYDVSLLPGEFIEDNLFDATIRGAIEDALVEQLTEMVPQMLADLQATLDLSMTAELLGTEVTVSGGFADLSVDDDGLQIGVDVDVEVYEHLIGGGTLLSEDAAAEADRSADAAMLLADDLLNRGLYELWAGGLLNQSLSTLDGSLDPEVVADYGITTATITTLATLPPVVVATGSGMQLQIGGLQVHANTPGWGMGENITLGVTATADIGLSFDDGEIAPVVSNLTFSPDIVEMDWEHDPETILEMVSGFITPELLLGAVDGVAFEVPSLAGVVLDAAEVSHTGAHSDLRLTLSAE